MNALYYIFLLTHFGVTASLVLDVEGGGGSLQGGSLIMQILQGGSGFYALYVINGSATARALLKKSWPMFLLVAVAAASAVWSVDPYLTIRRSTNLAISFLLAIALVGQIGAARAIHLVIRVMLTACVMSVIAVIVAPTLAVHQATDEFQNVHAGLWRGLLAHKVSLGMFSGLTLALLLFYGARSCGNPLLWVIGILAAASCLIGSNSATGIVTMILVGGLLCLSSFLKSCSQRFRQGLVKTINVGLLVLAYLIFTGNLDRFATLLGRSADLTGRATYWPHVEAFINAYGYYLGFGYGAGFRIVGPLIKETAGMHLTEAHNGILELIVGLGHIGMTFVMGMYAWFVWRASQIVSVVHWNSTKATFFPYAVLSSLFIISYAESIILSFNGVWAVLFALSLAVLHAQEMEFEESERSVEVEDEEETYVAL